MKLEILYSSAEETGEIKGLSLAEMENLKNKLLVFFKSIDKIKEEVDTLQISLCSVDSDEMRTLNKQYRSLDEPTDVLKYWRDDLVAFLLGCSFSFEGALIEAGIPIRHIDSGCNVPMYITNIQCNPAGRLSGPMVVSMRPVKHSQVVKAALCTGRFPAVHGAPVHIGDPAVIGIKDVNKPDFGDPVEIRDGEVPVFWACGVTPQAVVMKSKPPFAITHAPGLMFIGDPKDADYSTF